MECRLTQTAVEVLRAQGAGSHLTQAALEVLRTNTVGVLLTQVSVEVLRTAANLRATQVAAEILRTNVAGARLSQVSTEILRTNTSGARVSQASLEVLRENTSGARASQVAVEILREYMAGARATQAAVEVLRENIWPAYVTQVVAEALRTGDADARVTQTVAEVLRTGDADARVTSLVMEVLRENAPVELNTPGIRPWPFRANAKFDLVETYGYLSEVLRARAGAEQRRLLRETASGRVSFTCTLLTARELQCASALLGSMIGQEIGVPLWQYKQPLLSNLPPGSTSVPADTTTVPFYVDGLVMLWRSPWAWELFEVASVGSGALGVSDAIQAPWLARVTSIVPVVIGYLEEREELRRHAIEAGDYELDFEIPAFFP